MKTILLNTGETTLVDDIDFEFILSFGPWFVAKGHKTKYAQAYQNEIRRHRHMHRLIVERAIGSFTGVVDHEDRNGFNNQRFNLRVASKSQNGANRGLNENNTSGFKGVSYCKMTDRWESKISIKGTTYKLGRFNDPVEAAKAYDCAAKSTWKEFAWLNFP